jgi:hypothetical protein
VVLTVPPQLPMQVLMPVDDNLFCEVMKAAARTGLPGATIQPVLVARAKLSPLPDHSHHELVKVVVVLVRTARAAGP